MMGRMIAERSRWQRWVGVVLLASACSDPSDPSAGESGGDDDGEDDGDGDDENTPSTTSTGSTSAPDSDESAADFFVEPDMGATVACDIYADDCPPDQKCSPYASDGSVRPDATRCVDLVEFPAPAGAPCHVQEWTASGLDDCDRGQYCVVYDAIELDGTCTPFCSTDEEGELVCEEPATCIGNPDIIPRLCMTDCNPLEPMCPPLRGCYRVNDHFACLSDTSGPGGGYGDPCFFTNECDPSSFCADPPEFFECPHPMGCCTAFCDTTDPEASANCPGAPEHMCVRLFDDGEGPPGLNHIGACITGPEVSAP
jgi:hypothetical protein